MCTAESTRETEHAGIVLCIYTVHTLNCRLYAQFNFVHIKFKLSSSCRKCMLYYKHRRGILFDKLSQLYIVIPHENIPLIINNEIYRMTKSNRKELLRTLTIGRVFFLRALRFKTTENYIRIGYLKILFRLAHIILSAMLSCSPFQLIRTFGRFWTKTITKKFNNFCLQASKM